MEVNRQKIKGESSINIINNFKNFLIQSKFQDLYSKNGKYLSVLFAYAQKYMKAYLQNYNKKANLARRNLLYIKNFFVKNEFGTHRYKNFSNLKEHGDKAAIFFLIFSVTICLELLKCKDESNSTNKKKEMSLLNNLLSNLLYIIGNFYSAQIINEEHLEAILKFLLILSMSSKNEEAPNMNDNIENMMFLVQAIKIIKIIFNKIYQSKKEFNKKQKELMNNIIIFLKNNIIGYSGLKPLNIINKFYLSHNDYYTTSLMDLAYITIKMKDDKIKKNFCELLTNIYIFSFKYENLMSQLLKLIEPLLLNIDKKYKEEINSEIEIINFILCFIKDLNKREEKLLKEEPILREGFFMGNKHCGISSEIDSLEDDFSLMFGFCLCERKNINNNIKEWSLINIRNKENKDKDKVCQIRIWLSKRRNTNDEYDLIISDKNKEHETNVIIKSRINYIFSFNFIKNKKVRISYISDTSGKINKSEEINLKFNIDNTNIYIGCDKRNNLEEEYNTFFGCIGTIIILNNKKLAKKGDENIDLILQLKGDYASTILMSSKDNDSKTDLINCEQKFAFKNLFENNNVLDRLKEIYESAKIKFVESIKIIISPYSLKLVEYDDEIDYLKKFNNFKKIERSNIEVRQNYLNLKQKSSSSKGEKLFKIFSPCFNSEFNIFENKYSLEEFMKYDGIYYLCLLLEYFYQILCKIEKDNKNNYKDILVKVEENMIEIIKFFSYNIINVNCFRNFHSDINKFFYQVTVTLKKYISINYINDEILNLIHQLIDKITDIIKEADNEDESLKNVIFELKSKFLGLLHDIFISFYVDNQWSYFIYHNYITIASELLTKGKLDDLYSNEFIDEFLDISYIFETQISFFKHKDEKSIEELQNLYEEFLIKLLRNSNQICKAEALKKKEEQKNMNRKNSKRKYTEEKQKEEKIENPYLAHYIERAFQKEKNQYVFSRLLKVIYKSDLISDIKPIFIEQIQSILLNNYQKKEKKMISESCLKILLGYSIANQEDEEKIHNFLKELTYEKGFFYSVIASIKQIKYIFDDDKSMKDNNANIHEVSKQKMGSGNTPNPDSKNENEIYPLKDLDLNNLNKKQTTTLIKLFQDCISMLFIFDQVQKTKIINENIEINDAQEIYNTLKVNIDAIFNIPGKKVYKDLFNSESQITSELFYFKWKKSKEHDKITLLEDIKKYHKELLKNHRFPFIFKLILLIDSDKESNFITGKIDFILDLLIYIIEEFETFFNQQKKIKKEEKEVYYYIDNLINCLVLMDKIVLKKEKEIELIYIKKEKFRELFFKLIDLLKNTGLLYSNYCFEVDDRIGKLISEICYDIFILLLDYKFKENKVQFVNTFIINDTETKQSYSIFYLMDLNKEEILKREKQIIRKEILNKYLKDPYLNLKIIHDNMLDTNNPEIPKIIFGNKIYKIEKVNFTMYFLAKSFIYFIEMKEEFTEEFKAFFNSNLLLLSLNLFTLYTKNIAFYGQKICNRFPLYKETKEFFELKIIQHENDFKIYEEFFTKDIHFKTNGQDKIEFCYASRLLDIIDYGPSNNDNKKGKKFDIKKLEKLPTFSSYTTAPFENKCFLTFDKLVRENVILNPKNNFLKIVFSSAFKDIFFKDKIFQKIKYSFSCKYRKNIGFELRTKQLEYPSKEKNFSNSLEPKSFLRRDYNFYKNDFFPVSHGYINKELICDRDDNKLFFYRHKFERDIKNEKKEFKCELITNQFLYFGKFRLHKDYIFFESENDPRDKNPKEKENIYSFYIFSTKDNENSTNKYKEILMFTNDIKEIIRKRTLLMRQSLEIFNKNGKSYFFNFFKIKECEQICEILKNECKINIEEGSKDSIKSKISLFKKGEISNYEYLLYLNKLSTRTFNDLSQYPVFPWIVKDIVKLIQEDGKKCLDKNSENSKKSGKSNEEEEEESNYRNMNFPISMQSPTKRKKEIEKFEEDINYINFPYHCGTHYSTSSYIYYYLMRNNPYSQNMIRLQNYKQENPNRMFLSFKDTQRILKSSSDNRELIPDLFCYIDYLINLNCAFFGLRNKDELVDDFNIFEKYGEDVSKDYNLISDFVKYLYVHKKLLNDTKTTKEISKWVDIIFGKKQFPEKVEEKKESCNIFGKLTYEQHTNLDEKLKIYIKRFEDDKTRDKKELELKLLGKIQNRINIINNFGSCPCQILTESVNYEGTSPSVPQKKNKKMNKVLKSDNYFHFSKINNIYFAVTENSKESGIKKVEFADNIQLKNSSIYVCGNFETNLFLNNNSKDYLNNLYKPNYAISLISVINLFHIPEIFILTCRYLGSYFKVQNNDKEMKVICEDFVTTIISENTEKNDKGNFYTGLKNGKLIKWQIKLLPYDNQKNKNKSKNNKSSFFNIEEINHVYDHKKSITAIEINNKKEIIATSGEDNYIHIRKLYDLEILTVIDLTYCYGNEIVSKSQNIFPSLLRISDLNCIYVLFYDFDSDNTFIRGYTLNGLFFAQTQRNESLKYNNIIINKNGNIMVGLYNDNKIIKLNSFDLKIREEKEIPVTNHIGNKWIELDSLNNFFIILYDNECHFYFIDDEIERKLLDE